MLKTGFVYHEDFLLHDTGTWHPERADRLKSIVQTLSSTGLKEKLKTITPEPAQIKWIETIHTTEYVKSIEKACDLGYKNLDADTTICSDSYRIALLAAGSGISAADKIMNGEIQNGFCAVRPPGHHAEKKRAMGFCLFNNVAITARYLQQKFSLKKNSNY